MGAIGKVEPLGEQTGWELCWHHAALGSTGPGGPITFLARVCLPATH